MNLENINSSIQFNLWVVCKTSNLEVTNYLFHLNKSDSNYEYNFIQNEKIIKVKLRDKHQQNDLDFHLKRGCVNLAQIIQVADNGATALLKINFFNGDIIEMGEVEIGIDERIVDTAKRQKLLRRSDSIEELTPLLRNRCLINMGEVGTDTYFLIMVGAASNDDFIYDEYSDQSTKTKDTTEIVPKQMRCFSIYGDRLRIPVEKRKQDKSAEIFFATKLINKQNHVPEGSLCLAKGQISFSDYTKIGRIRALASGSMSRLILDKGSYLKKWDEYGDVEGDLLLSFAKAVGKLKYHNIEVTDKGVKFFFNSSVPSELSEGDELEITSKDPLYIQNHELTWEEYSFYLEQKFSIPQNNSKNFNDSIYAKIIKIDSTSLVLESNDNNQIPIEEIKDNFLVLSINGDITQIKRRMKARRLILEGRSANPLLGLLIEEGGEIPDIQRGTNLKPLTPFVREKIFKHPPTEIQVKAIDIALNTPDIALIQGPPGTGKTTVITAILERLNEENDKTKSICGEILVSGFQHDAVENIVSRLSINALPAVKFGSKSGNSEFAEDSIAKKINDWRKNVVKNVRLKNPQITQTQEQIKLSELFFLYSSSPSINNIKNLLNLILKLPRNILTQKLSDKTSQILETIKSEVNFQQFKETSTLRAIRSLRISSEGFLDDGKEKAGDVLEYAENSLNESDKKSLKKAIIWKEGQDLNFLEDIKKIKLKLLDLYTPKKQFKEKPREDILELIAEVSVLLEKNKKRVDQTDVILANFLHELENNPDGIRETIEDYNYVFAATTQQAEGSAIKRAKRKNNNDFIKYDTVIVDEAARTSPRDLLIPMAQAEKRIILVGDHRQLPHLIDEEVAKALESGKSNEVLNQDFVKKSMFEYLFKRLKQLEKKDGISRTVTLDAQYRTHSLLGDFVSNNFYKIHGEEYRSPLPESLFAHNLEGTNGCAAACIKIPNKNGKEKRQGTSRCRPIEANMIAEFLKKWIDSDEGKKLSFGVISFYKAQTYAVFEALSKYGITKKSQGQTWNVSDEYKFLEKEEHGKIKSEERLRIGTVDAFQGMEFDIVFLSMVRSQDINRLRPDIKKKNNEDKARLLFGHLMSENRLCVSMSRQKKLLVLVGDSELALSGIGKEFVPALGNYFDLCSQNGVIL
ncbi:MAG: DNA polymerase III delta prime subunit [bacterium]|jgi:DNA polymerase III delta prime subunit